MVVVVVVGVGVGVVGVGVGVVGVVGVGVVFTVSLLLLPPPPPPPQPLSKSEPIKTASNDSGEGIGSTDAVRVICTEILLNHVAETELSMPEYIKFRDQYME